MANGSDEITTRSGDNKGFIHAVMNEEVEAVAYYLSIGMDVNFLDPEIMTNSLIEAVKVGNTQIVEMLMKEGANPSIVSQLGESPIGIAKAKGDKKLLDLLGYQSNFLSNVLGLFNPDLSLAFCDEGSKHNKSDT